MIQNGRPVVITWAPTPLAPIPFLRELRELVLERAVKKFPRWRFALVAEELLLQLQPRPIDAVVRRWRPGACVLFEGLALAAGDVHEADFEGPRRRTVVGCKFTIVEGEDTWWVQPRCVFGQPREVRWGLPARVWAALSPAFGSVAQPAQFLSDHCLMCGKAMWDPPSIARRIGPECAGTGRGVSPVYVMRRARPTPALSPPAAENGGTR
jgi:hypothetical protein